MTEEPPDLVPLAAAAERLDLSTEAVRKWIQRGTLVGEKVDGAWFVRASAALWQERARVLEGRLLALGAGDEPRQDAPTTRSGPAHGAERAEPTEGARWRRWWRRLGGGP